jgi:galactokinase
LVEAFRRQFGSAEGVRVFRAPGRVNLIGEHTDYNLGFVLPVALDLATYVAAAPSGDGCLRIWSEQRQELRQWPLTGILSLRPSHDWSDYVIGVALELVRAGYSLPPLSLLIRSTVPEGSGLSSSAALEVSCALSLLQDHSADPLALAQLCRRAEGSFVGMPCGIMDQYISIFGRESSAIRIDCRSLEHETVALPAGAAFVAVNSMVRHSLAGSAYKQRTEECAAAAAAMGVASLRDATLEMCAKAALPDNVARRARHIVTENERVTQFIAACRQGDLNRMGSLFLDSHRSLRDDYEVSCLELDFLVENAAGIPGVYGARMTGGGFGGCTVNLLQPGSVDAFCEKIRSAYAQRFGVVPQVYLCRPSQGAEEVKNFERIPPAR